MLPMQRLSARNMNLSWELGKLFIGKTILQTEIVLAKGSVDWAIDWNT